MTLQLETNLPNSLLEWHCIPGVIDFDAGQQANKWEPWNEDRAIQENMKFGSRNTEASLECTYSQMRNKFRLRTSFPFFSDWCPVGLYLRFCFLTFCPGCEFKRLGDDSRATSYTLYSLHKLLILKYCSTHSGVFAQDLLLRGTIVNGTKYCSKKWLNINYSHWSAAVLIQRCLPKTYYYGGP